MTQVVFKRTGGPAVAVQGTFNNKVLKFNAAGVAIANVPGGDDYGFSWFAKGTPGAAWSLVMTAPLPGLERGGLLDDSGRDHDSQYVYIP